MVLGYSWDTVGIQLGYGWDTDGIRLGYGWDTIGIQLGYSWDMVGIQFHLHYLPGKMVNVTRIGGGFGVLVLDLMEVVESA